MQKKMIGEPVDFTDPINQGLVLYLRMNEGMGDHAADLSLNANHGTLYNMAYPGIKTSGWTPGFRGKTIAFDGADDYIDCGNGGSLGITDGITVSVWVNQDALKNTKIIAKSPQDTTVVDYALGSTDTGNLIFKTYTTVWHGVDSTDAISPMSWYHCVGTFDGNTWNIYINGLLSNSQVDAVNLPTTGILEIGRYYHSTPTQYFNGSIDEVRIYNRTLTQSEITRLYMEGMPSKSTTHAYPKYFVFDVETTGVGDTFALPLEASGTYDFEVHWGDGSWDIITAHNDAAVTHTYASGGTHQIVIDGHIEGWRFNNTGDCAKMRDISAWGCLLLGNFGSYFFGCNGLTVSATDVLNLDGTTNLYQAFRGCGILADIPGLNGWDIGSVTNLGFMFNACFVFNQDISGWDVSNVTNMYRLFSSASAFNQDISSWDTGKVSNMYWMFYLTTSFDQDISSWDITSLTNATNMFFGVTLSTANYDALLIGWEAQAENPNVTFGAGNSKYSSHEAVGARAALIANGWTITDGGTTAPFIFSAATTSPAETFALPLEASGVYDFHVDWGDSSSSDITVWNHADVTHTYASAGTHTITINGTIKGFRFGGAGDCAKIRDISAWGCLLLGNNNGYFYNCAGLTVSATDILNLTGTTTLNYMFRGCTALTNIPNINSWDVSNITDMGSVFSLTSFNVDISSWDVSNVTTFISMFYSNNVFNQDISGWDTSSCLIMDNMFYGASAFDQDIGNWDITSLTAAVNMFLNITLSTANYDALLIGWEGQVEQPNVVFHGGSSQYSAGAAATAKAALQANGWTITDGGQVP